MGMIFPSKNTGTPDLSTSTILGKNGAGSSQTGHIISESFQITLQGTGNSTVTTFSCSLNPNNQDYIFRTISDNPNNSKTAVNAYAGTPGYSYINFKNLQKSVLGTGALAGYGNIGSGSKLVISDLSSTLVFNGNKGQTEGYSYASTP